ncbi:hypothetical protein BZP36_22220 [Raoultella terrigena]|nr:hypothetical protein BZP36_22220 [Raoultella terrigena]
MNNAKVPSFRLGRFSRPFKSVKVVFAELRKAASAAEDLAIQDFIYWQPDALVSGVEPIYVLLASPRDLLGKVTGKGEQVGDG